MVSDIIGIERGKSAGHSADPQEPDRRGQPGRCGGHRVHAGQNVPADDVIALASKAGIGLLGFEGDTWTLAKKLYELGLR